MADLTVLELVDATNYTFTGTAGTYDAFGSPLTGLAASTKYAILAQTITDINSTTENFQYKLQVGDGTSWSDIANSEQIQEEGTSRHPTIWFTVITTAAADEDQIRIVHTPESGGSATLITTFHNILVIDLDDLTENTDYYYVSDSTGAVLGTSWSTKLTKTFDGGGDDWLAIASVRFDVNNNLGKDYMARLGKTSDYSTLQREGEDAAEFRNEFLVRGFAALSGSNTLTLDVQHDNSGPGTAHDYEAAEMLLLRLETFETHALFANDGTVTPVASTWVEAGTVSFTPTNTGNAVAIGGFIVDHDAINQNQSWRMQRDGTSIPHNEPSTAVRVVAFDSADDTPTLEFSYDAVTGSTTYTYDIDGYSNSADVPTSYTQRALAVFTVEIGATDANVTAVTVAATAAVPAPTVVAEQPANVTPATVAAAAAMPAPTITAEQPANVAATVAAASAAVPAPTVAAGTAATVTPSTVAAIAAMPAPTVAAGTSATEAAAVVAATVAVPAPTVEAGTAATVTPSTVAATATVPAPTVGISAPVTATTAAATAAVPAPTVAAGTAATVTPSTVAATAAIPAATVAAGTAATVTPSTVPAAAAVPDPTVAVSTNANVDAATVAATAAINAPTIAAGTAATPSPSTVAATAAVPAPTVADGAAVNVTPATVAATVEIRVWDWSMGPGMGGTEISVGTTVAPSTVAATAAVPAPTVAAGTAATAAPSTVAAVAAVPAPTVDVGGTPVNVSPATVAATAAVGTATVGAGTAATVAPSTVAATAAVPAPTIDIAAAVTPATVAATAAVGTVTVNAGTAATVTAVTVAATAAVPAPTVAAGTAATINATTVVVTVGFGAATISDSNTITITAKEVGRFYRTVNGHLLLMPHTRGQTFGLIDADKVSSAFLHNTGEHETIMASVADEWAAHSGSATATLLTAIDTKLQLLGYRDYDGNDLV